MRRNKLEEYNDYLARLYPEIKSRARSELSGLAAKTVTFVVTNRCSLACTYCYQKHKNQSVMSFDTAKKFVDLLLSGKKGFGSYIDKEESPGIILEFIGGEPLLEIDLIDRIVDYFREQTLLLGHPWADNFMLSICSNGVAYTEPAVQRFLQKNTGRISFSVTLDGNRELHDACRVFPDGSPSYHLAYAACRDWMSRGNYMGSKITLCPENVEHTFAASKHMMDMGYQDININCVYEEGWTGEHASILYYQLKKVADYLLSDDNSIDADDIYYAFFNEDNYRPMAETETQNYCGGNGMMLACGTDGRLYPCLRYVETSVGDEVAPMVIGNLEEGIGIAAAHRSCIDCLTCVNRRSQSTEECFYCPIAQGCGWCTALNYQETGSPDKRLTHTCEMHKAASLANVYFWNRYYRKQGSAERFTMYCPKEWAIPIIGEDEYQTLKTLSGEE